MWSHGEEARTIGVVDASQVHVNHRPVEANTRGEPLPRHVDSPLAATLASADYPKRL
jgi:hypothetical protein